MVRVCQLTNGCMDRQTNKQTQTKKNKKRQTSNFSGETNTVSYHIIHTYTKTGHDIVELGACIYLVLKVPARRCRHRGNLVPLV